MVARIIFSPYQKVFELELLTLWRQSFHEAVALQEDTRQDVVSEHLEFLRSRNPACITVALEENSNKLTGFMRLTGNIIEDLFIHVNYQRQGIGSRFMQQAMHEKQWLSLSTFELNKGAQKFYQLHGFVVVKRGYASFADNPWATHREQLADLTYEWRRS
ncbi:MAG TPA: N-acetyltransferase [Gammaproteobacteria bacterium]|nr:N-acetyltransferase [Gammaproteobacteria bacterium]HIK69500.1 N-acetyltransferase [Pseudomonadales bacterium]